MDQRSAKPGHHADDEENGSHPEEVRASIAAAGAEGAGGGPLRVVSSRDEQQRRSYQVPDLGLTVRSVIGRSSGAELTESVARMDSPEPQDVPNDYKQTEVAVVPGAVARAGHSTGPSKGPSFKDQVCATPRGSPSARQISATDEKPPAAQGGRGLPTFKDQAQDAQNPQARDEKNLDATSRNSSSDASPSPDASVTDSWPVLVGGSPRLIQAHVVDEENNASSSDAFPVTAEVMTGGLFLRRRSVLLIAGMILVAGATVGGVCGATGKCSRNDAVPAAAPMAPSVSVNAAPVTETPSMNPSSAPTVGNYSLAMVEFIEGIRFSLDPITYPAPMENATSEELAVQWLLQEHPLALMADNEDDRVRLTQRYALATLYFGMNGPSWLSKDGWLDTEDECTWFGVECSDNRVSTIGENDQFKTNNLNGLISPDIALLESLTELHLHDNPNLMGSLPVSIGNLKLLDTLNLKNCGLTGSLPPSMADMTALTSIEIASNAFTGMLPPWIGRNWTKLVWFDTQSNFFTGPLPESIGLWSDLLVRPQNQNRSNSLFVLAQTLTLVPLLVSGP